MSTFRAPKQTKVIYRDALADLVEALDRMHGKTYLSLNVCYARDCAKQILAKEAIDTRDPADRTTEEGLGR